MKNPTFATRWNADLIDENYARWQEDPASIDPTWQAFFEGFMLAAGGGSAPGVNGSAASAPSDQDAQHRAIKQARFTGAIYAYRSIGHTQANINPLYKEGEAPSNPRLTLERLGFEEADLDEVYWTGNYMDGTYMSVRDLLDALNETYCGSIGVEYLHIQETPIRRWLQSKMEPNRNRPQFDAAQKGRILDRLIKAEQFEKFLHTRYVGQKRFGLEGAETLIAAIDSMVYVSPLHDVKEIIMGMAHRGRLNVLANVLRKPFATIFHEFSPNYVPDTKHGDGDVKYHLGYSSTVDSTAGEGQVELHLTANPSHLEAVNPVAEGRARAHQRLRGDTAERKQVVPLLIHGDAAFAGQGVVAEVLNFSQLPGYQTGGTIHFIINNQIGFTTDPAEARSSLYCTDVAKMIEAPIFHVNGDDPEAVVWVTLLALEFRQKFGRDVVIDMYCYRRHGHNESDEPAFTQPTLYKQIKDHPNVSDIYGPKLIASGVGTKEDMEAIVKRRHDALERSYEEMKQKEADGDEVVPPEEAHVANYQPGYAFRDVNTAVDTNELNYVAEELTRIPDGFNLNPKIKRQLETKLKNYQDDEGIDWAFAESLAWGTLMLEGYHVRLSGQDVQRGTFSHRHAVLFDAVTREKYIPLMQMEKREGMLCVHNSLLSEAAVLGFDYGYSLDYPNMLCMWEAQFGDFVNGAQVIIDQFIVSSETKWQRVSGLVMLLPHGYEGQGPEHSSARLERFLQLCAEDNIQVANVSTPAQLFHILRRQMHRDFRKPLIMMAPKSLLRHKECVSKKAEFTESCFRSILPDAEEVTTPKRVIMCSGKVYYDLIAYRRDNEIKDTAIVRVEQFYPFNGELLGEILQQYASYENIVWCQEEPENMGAWTFLMPRLEKVIGRRPLYAGRDAAASPAVGSLGVHLKEQQDLVKAAFTLTA
ncbi:MAG: 2-oxoglutarate dehydrogenase E1 component [Verrucomicrobiota bacterium JB022]|nr:2-oxoglutarate dehydrogenase E1 component [Verrucomicrobiota bacterium JB022]